MNNKKQTKKALCMSVLSMVLCVAMLVGMTFAWFTDTASTAVNKIQAGKLKVDIVNEAGTSIKDETIKFVNKDESANILWEPGVTFNTTKFKIKNDGNLALKYKLALNLNGITGNKELLDVIEFSVIDEAGNKVALDTFEGNLAKEALSGALYIQGKMSKEAGNKYQNMTLDGIAITVYATQDTVENDSKDNQYDKNATYPVNDFATLQKKFEGSGVYNVTEDIDVKDTLALTGFNALTLDATGKTISNTDDLWGDTSWSLISARNNSTLTVAGGTFAAKKNDCYAVDVQDGATVTIKDGTFVGNIHAVYVQEGTAK